MDAYNTLSRFLRRFSSLSIALIPVLLIAPLSAQEPAKDAGFSTITPEMAERFREETRLVLAYMSSRHYEGQSFDEIDSKELLEAYMKELDYAKLFFIESDRERINMRFADTLKPAYLVKGNLFPAFEIFSIYRERALDRLNWVFARLEGEFDFTTDRTYNTDRREAVWPTDEASAEELWENRLTYEMLQEVLDGSSIDAARDRLVRRYERLERNLLNIEPFEVEEMFLNSFTGLYDPHSNFFSVESAEDFAIQISNSLQGIGAVLSDEDGYCVIRELMPGGPAELSGQINPGDKIVAVAQGDDEPVDVVDMKLSKVVKQIRGPKGSEVRLSIIPASNPSARQVVTLIRDEIRLTANLASAWLYQVPGEDGNDVTVGVIDLPSFYGGMGGGGITSSTSNDVEELLVKLQELGAEGIVLDLRRNGGGLLSEAIRLTGLFIPEGPVVQVRYLNGQVRTDRDEDPSVAYTGPLAVLVSRNSASASEIVAGALQSLGRAVIVGDKTTHGKGTVQQPIPLNELRSFRNPFERQTQLGMIKITIQKFYLPDGASTQKEGVRSDIVIPSANEFLPIGEADLEHALVWDSIDPADWAAEEVFAPGGARVTPELLAHLRERSIDRLTSEEEFQYLKDSIERFRIRQERKDVSLNLEQRLREREEEEQFKRDMERLRDELADKYGYEAVKVTLDLTATKEKQHQQQLHDALLPNGKPRANQYYQKVFYFEDHDGHIKPINVETFNYERARRQPPGKPSTNRARAPSR